MNMDEEDTYSLRVTKGDCDCGARCAWGTKMTQRITVRFRCRSCAAGLFSMACMREFEEWHAAGALPTLDEVE